MGWKTLRLLALIRRLLGLPAAEAPGGGETFPQRENIISCNETKLNMPKQHAYYQYLYGDRQGEIVELEYIDDLDPDNKVAVFDNGDKCLLSLIGDLNDASAYDDKKIMCRVESERNCWTFAKVEPTVKMGRDKDGVEHEIPDPYFFDNTGAPIQRSGDAPRVNVKAPARCGMDPIRDWGLYSLVEQEKDKAAQTPSITPIKPADQPFQPPMSIDDFDAPNPYAYPLSMPAPELAPSTIYKDVREVNNLLLDLDDPELATGALVCMLGGKMHDLGNIKEFLTDYLAESECAAPEHDGGATSQESLETINTLLKNCKTKDSKITLNLTVSLPMQSFMDYFKDNYPAEWTEDLLRVLARKIDADAIRDALIRGLKDMSGFCK